MILAKPLQSGAPIIALVVARGQNGAIGLRGDLPWRISTDLRQFRRVTLGKPVIMGRRTFQSLKRPLDQRVNIVLSRDRSYRPEGAVVANNLQTGLDQARRAAEAAGVGEITVIGGDEVFREVMPLAGRIYLTEVHASPEADTWFSPFDPKEWREVSREDYPAGPRDEHAFSFVLLERSSPSLSGAEPRAG